jgi:divalent metal cation (Fe/Co/Zn/Cd) transporter
VLLMATAAVLLGPSPARRTVLARRVRWLVAGTIGWNAVEAAVAITTGTVASSTALVGFGLDSVVEVSSAAVVAWQFAARDPQRREPTALRLVAGSFFVLAGYVAVTATWTLLADGHARPSVPGVALAACSLLVMPILSYLQRRAGRELGSRSAVADSKQALLCTYLSAVLLVGLALNAVVGWSWADPAAALVIAGVAAREGRQAWRGESCCPTPGAAADAGHPDGACDCAPGCECRR